MSKECTYKLKKHLLLVHTVILTKTMTNEGELKEKFKKNENMNKDKHK